MSIGEKINHNEIQKSEFATRQETQALGNTTKKNVYLLLHKCMVKYCEKYARFAYILGLLFCQHCYLLKHFKIKQKLVPKLLGQALSTLAKSFFLGPSNCDVPRPFN